jgi:hypothetical protein
MDSRALWIVEAIFMVELGTQKPFFKNDYFRASRLIPEPIFVVVRSSKVFESPQDAQIACVPLLQALALVDRKLSYLLLDSRHAVGRSNPEYEEWFASFRRDLFAVFPRAAVLVKTMAGQLHSRRLLKVDHAVERVQLFTDERRALSYLRGVYRDSLRPPPGN